MRGFTISHVGLRQQMLEEILNGTSIIGNIPNSIGDIVYCDTTGDLHKNNTSGTDYFLGTKGFCALNFKKERGNILETKGATFDIIEDVLISKVHGERNSVDWGVFYSYYFMSKNENNFKVIASFSGDNDSIEMAFLDAVDSQWTEYLLKSQNGATEHAFRYYDDNKAYSNFLVVNSSELKINGKTYIRGDVKVSFDNGSLLVRGIKCRKILNMYFGEHQWWPLNNIGNSSFLVRLLANYGWLSNR